MKKVFFLTSLFCMAASSASGVTVLSTDSGTSEQSIKQGVSDGIFDTMAKHAGDWVANGTNKIGDWALQTLFGIYDKYIGTFLIKIPDLASPQTYTALVNSLGVGVSANTVQEVLNILKITTGTGLFFLIVGFVIDTGQRSSGLWDRFIDGSEVIGFVAAFLFLFAWPTVHSYMTNGVSAMGYYIYSQNTLMTSGVLEGIQNIDLNSGGSVGGLSQFDFRGSFITIQGIAWNLIYLISIALVVLGFYNCYSAVSAGDSQRGNYKFFQAVAGIILILGVPTIIHIFIDKGADAIGSQQAIPGQTLTPFSLQGLVQENGVQYPQEQAQAASNIGVAGNNTILPQSRLAIFSAGLLKCGVSLWGLIICFAVIFAKFFQVLNIWVMFILGPVFIGCLGHPSSASIFWGAARYFLKLLLYSVIWSITLVGLYLIPNINWGVETIGVNSLLTAIAVLAGLQMIANVQEFASLFTTFGGANLRGDGYKEFTRDTGHVLGIGNSARIGTFGALKNATGETSQAMAAATGAAVGSIIPGVGTASGALAGQRTMQGFNAFAKVGAIGGREDQKGPDSPFSKMLKSFSGKTIEKNLNKEAGQNKTFSPKESEKRKLVGDYARKLQGKKPNPKPGQGPTGNRNA